MGKEGRSSSCKVPSTAKLLAAEGEIHKAQLSCHPAGRTCLGVQWVGVHLPMQGTRVRSLPREDTASRGATNSGRQEMPSGLRCPFPSCWDILNVADLARIIAYNFIFSVSPRVLCEGPHPTRASTGDRGSVGSVSLGGAGCGRHGPRPAPPPAQAPMPSHPASQAEPPRAGPLGLPHAMAGVDHGLGWHCLCLLLP